MFANSVQRFFSYGGYHLNTFARQVGRNVEKFTRPATTGCEKVCLVASTVVCVVFSVFSVVAMLSYFIASICGDGRFQLLEPESAVPYWQENSIKVMSWNVCFQDPWAPLTGGVELPGARIAQVVDAIAVQNPTLFLGQEFDSFGAQDEAISLLQQKGYKYFLRDLGCNDPIRNHSGLFAASKVPFENVEFIPYPSEDRSGLAKWSNQGALTFNLGKFRFVNVHLNYGDGPDNAAARHRQITNHILPLLKKGAVVLGDFNQETNVQGYTNALAGRVTCSDTGKHTLRGKPKDSCRDCAEKIDGLVHGAIIQVTELDVAPLPDLSDHYRVTATLGLV